VVNPEIAEGFGLRENEVVVSIHCGSRGLGHQIGTDYLQEMVMAAASFGIRLPDRELACAPIRSSLGQRYLGAMRAGINCALANRKIVTQFALEPFAEVFPEARLRVLYDVSHNTCKEETHWVNGEERRLFVHRKGATRAFPPGHPQLCDALRPYGQPVIIGGTMGTGSWVLAGTSPGRAWHSACHGAGRAVSRHQARKRWRGAEVVRELGARGIAVRAVSMRGVAEEAPGAYKDVDEVVRAAELAGLARPVARLEPIICIKG
ncbi:MAG: RtcB family protein, partial [Zetaproteobacteria bacterium]